MTLGVSVMNIVEVSNDVELIFSELSIAGKYPEIIEHGFLLCNLLAISLANLKYGSWSIEYATKHHRD